MNKKAKINITKNQSNKKNNKLIKFKKDSKNITIFLIPSKRKETILFKKKTNKTKEFFNWKIFSQS